MRKIKGIAVCAVLSLTLACGGGSGSSGNGGGGGGGGGIAGCSNGTSQTPSGNPIAPAAVNVAALTIDGGPSSLLAKNDVYVNGVFTTVTVCVPGFTDSTHCQNIDHVLVDTGSYGLRLLSSAGGGQLSLSLPQEKDNAGNNIAECAQFSDGITWGPVKLADIYVGGPTGPMTGESAKTAPGSGIAGMPTQIIGDSAFTAVPSACTSAGTPEDSLTTLFANGIIGVGPFPQDCGLGCAQSQGNPGVYYACPPSGCVSGTQATTIAVANQVWNPVAAFSTDNNGVIMELPGVPATGLSVVNGSLVFGIGTQSNNALGSATMYEGDTSANITTTFAGTPYSASFIDSGSNGYFFPSSIQQCSGNNSKGFYCPTSNLTCSAKNQGSNGSSGTIAFNVTNADALTSPNVAFNNLAGPNNPPAGFQTGFDWGLPFFFGRSVYTGIAQFDSQGNELKPPFYAY